MTETRFANAGNSNDRGRPARGCCFFSLFRSMKNSKAKILRLLAATRSLRANRPLLAVLFVLSSLLQLPAQNVVLTGAIGGRVTDQTGAIVPGATILVRNLATGLQHSAATNHAGLYQFVALMPGTYSVTATGKGFRDIEALVRVLVGNTTLQDFRLGVGSRRGYGKG